MFKIHSVYNYIIKPWSKDHTAKEKKIAWATTLILGVVSGGLFQIGTLLLKGVFVLKDNYHRKKSSVSKVNALSQKKLSPEIVKINELNKKIKKNINREMRLSLEITKIRRKLVKAESIEPSKIQDILKRRQQLKKLIEKTKLLEKERSDLLSKLKLPQKDAISHPEIQTYVTYISKIEKLKKIAVRKSKDPKLMRDPAQGRDFAASMRSLEKKFGIMADQLEALDPANIDYKNEFFYIQAKKAYIEGLKLIRNHKH